MPKRPRGPIASRSCKLVGRIGRLNYEFWYHRHGKPIAPGRWWWTDADGTVNERPAPGEWPMPKPPNQAQVEKVKTKPRKATQVFAKFKEVAGYLTDQVYPDGTQMGDVMLSVRTKGPVVLVQLKIAAHGGLRLQVEDECVDEALLALEAALQADMTPWEPDPFPLNGNVKKKK
jgi:hypothetical protein